MAQGKPPLRPPAYELADAFDANELFQQNGWTDGLPIVPPDVKALFDQCDAVVSAVGD